MTKYKSDTKGELRNKMSTDTLAAHEILSKRFSYPAACDWYVPVVESMEEYAAQQVEQQTKQLREELEKSQNSNSVLGEGWRRLKDERDKAVDLLGHANRILCHEIDIHHYGPFHDLLTSFLKQLNQNNEG